uniref:Uncharacterized protein n=1 Tax=Parascaris univalens TaxID=6257 RepID=A0A915B8D2_PARUN
MNPRLAGQWYFFERLAARRKRIPIANGVKVLLDPEVEPQVDLKLKTVTADDIVFEKTTKLHRCLINQYTLNSDELLDGTMTPYRPGPNLEADLAANYGYKVEFVTVVVGTCGEHVPAVKEDMQRMLDLTAHQINQYTLNLDELLDETMTSYPPGPNLEADLAANYGYKVEFVTVVVGTCGEHVPAVKEDMQRMLDLTPHQVGAPVEMIS